MSKYFTAAVETALKFNMITVVDAIEMGISEEVLQQIENDKVNAAYDRAVNDQVTIAINGAKIEQARQNRLSKFRVNIVVTLQQLFIIYNTLIGCPSIKAWRSSAI